MSEIAAVAEKGIEAVATAAGSTAVRSALHGRFKRALMWTIPVVLAGAVVWYIRK